MVRYNRSSLTLLLQIFLLSIAHQSVNAFQPALSVLSNHRLVHHRVHHPSPTIRVVNPPSYRFSQLSRDTTSDDEIEVVLVDPLILEVSKTLRRVSFFSWWSQVILSTVAAVILAFSKNVMNTNAMHRGPSLFLSGPGIILSALSIFWTYGNSRLSKRIVSKPTTRMEAATMLRRAIQVGATLNMVGLLFNLIAAEEIVGGLAIKVLTQQAQTGANFAAVSLPGLQPLDILVVQANTNSILSQFLSLASLLFMTDKVQKLRLVSEEPKLGTNI